MQKKIKMLLPAIMLLFIVILINGSVNVKAAYASDIKLIVDGKDITELSGPVIINSRTLVPVRFIAEEIGADVIWDGDNRTVKIVKGNISLFLRIGSYVVEYNNGESYQLSDVAPLIINDRTYVPVRLISNAFGVGVDWNNSTRTVTVDSSKTSTVQPFFGIRITSHQTGAVLTGKTVFTLEAEEKYISDASEIRFLLLDTDTATGFVVARASSSTAEFSYYPQTEDIGNKILVAAFYDENGTFIGGDSLAVTVAVSTQVSLTGIDETALVKGPLTMKPSMDFTAAYVKYNIMNYKNGTTASFDQLDPQSSFTWYPSYEFNGVCKITVTAYDSSGYAYQSTASYVTVLVDRKLAVSGVSEGSTINKAVTLSAYRNYNVSEIRYIARNSETKELTLLSTVTTGSYEWFPGPEFTGKYELFVIVTDKNGNEYESPVTNVTIDGSPKLLLSGVGPKQVLTSSATLKPKTNVTLTGVNYVFTDLDTGIKRYLASNINPADEFKYTPIPSDAGAASIMIEGIYQGTVISSETVTFTIYTGTIYGSKPIIEKDNFLTFASALAKESWTRTGMSAALQTAQAILETGWGQSVPVDKYNGKFSYNLFGIKGSATNGSVTSNTWEVYNGVSYRIDAQFRAYNNVQEGWTDHKTLLLTSSRYAPFRDVMYDSTLGAWAIKRAGYATDPLYPIKLMNLIKLYNLKELDRTGL
ncbi:MAG: glucosaminidase domain-containing protein [Clostridia bacterium]|nr:glucosaminidase domain-containing protein [Clostridia bacterium]